MGDLLQIQVDTPVRPRAFFYKDGDLTDLDGPAGGTCTVTLTRPDGTAGPASGTVGHVSTGIYDFALAGQADPVWFDIEWSGAISGASVKAHTQVEVLGNLLFSIPQLRGVKVAGQAVFADDTVWPDQQLMDARTAVGDEFEKILGFPPVPRFFRRTVNGSGTTCLFVSDGVLKEPRLLSLTINGTVQSVVGYEFNDASQLESIANYGYGPVFTWGRRNVVAELVHGWTRIPGDGSNFATVRAAMTLQPGFGSTATTVNTVDGNSYTYDRAGSVNRIGQQVHFGQASLAEWLNRWAAPTIGVA